MRCIQIYTHTERILEWIAFPFNRPTCYTPFIPPPPFLEANCVLEVLSVKVGDVVASNQQVATLLLTNHIWVRVFVPEPWLGRIKLGDAVKVRVDSFPGKDFAGAVEQIQRSAEFTPRNVQTVGERVKQVFGVKVRLDNSEGQFRAGMAADVVFPDVLKLK